MVGHESHGWSWFFLKSTHATCEGGATIYFYDQLWTVQNETKAFFWKVHNISLQIATIATFVLEAQDELQLQKVMGNWLVEKHVHNHEFQHVIRNHFLLSFFKVWKKRIRILRAQNTSIVPIWSLQNKFFIHLITLLNVLLDRTHLKMMKKPLYTKFYSKESQNQMKILLEWRLYFLFT